MKVDFMARFPATVCRHSNSVSTGERGEWNMPGEFEGKIVVISGASRGIGRGIALAFARAGAQTVLASSSEQNLTAAIKVIAAEGPQPFTVAGDLSQIAAWSALS